MHFQVRQHQGLTEDEALKRTYGWTLEKTDEEIVARSPHNDFDTEAQARSNIAKAKRSMKAAARCKVKSP